MSTVLTDESFVRTENLKWFTHELLTKIALGLYGRSKDVDELVCMF